MAVASTPGNASWCSLDVDDLALVDVLGERDRAVRAVAGVVDLALQARPTVMPSRAASRPMTSGSRLAVSRLMVTTSETRLSTRTRPLAVEDPAPGRGV